MTDRMFDMVPQHLLRGLKKLVKQKWHKLLSIHFFFNFRQCQGNIGIEITDLHHHGDL